MPQRDHDSNAVKIDTMECWLALACNLQQLKTKLSLTRTTILCSSEQQLVRNARIYSNRLEGTIVIVKKNVTKSWNCIVLLCVFNWLTHTLDVAHVCNQ